MSDPTPHFGFVQLELPWALGPADGRYVVRGHAGEVDRVVVLATLGAPRRAGRLARRRARAAPPQPGPAPVTTGRATVVRPEPLPDPADWLAAVDLEAEAAAGLVVLNAVLHAQRVASADPWLREVARDQALVVRVGVGRGEAVAEGRWAEARELPAAPPARRSAALRPQERLAALLGGRDVALACEDLVLRARADLTAGRLREAALQADVALRTGVAELEAWQGTGDLARRLEELRTLAPPVADAAASALLGGVGEAEAQAVLRGVERLEAALRARSAAGF